MNKKLLKLALKYPWLKYVIAVAVIGLLYGIYSLVPMLGRLLVILLACFGGLIALMAFIEPYFIKGGTHIL